MREKNYAAVGSSDAKTNNSVMNMFKLIYFYFRFISRKRQERRCSFCSNKLPDDSVIYDGVSACPHCFFYSSTLIASLRKYADIKNKGSFAPSYRCYRCDKEFTASSSSACITLCKLCSLVIPKNGARSPNGIFKSGLPKVADYIRRRI